jgi:hypothetical protein
LERRHRRHRAPPRARHRALHLRDPHRADAVAPDAAHELPRVPTEVGPRGGARNAARVGPPRRVEVRGHVQTAQVPPSIPGERLRVREPPARRGRHQLHARVTRRRDGHRAQRRAGAGGTPERAAPAPSLEAISRPASARRAGSVRA